MKRTPLKRKATVPMKRGTLRKKSKNKIPTLKRKLWEVFARYIKARDKNTCFTCDKVIVNPYENNAGHFIPKAAGGMALYFHEDNVHVQCSKCNCYLGGNQYIYGERLGTLKASELQMLRFKIEKWNEEDYLRKIDEYTQKLK